MNLRPLQLPRHLRLLLLAACAAGVLLVSSGMKYKQIRSVPESEDPSLAIETKTLVAKLIDNTGLELKRDERASSPANQYGLHKPIGYSHFLGSHGIRTLYDKQEKRNVVVPGACWLNLQNLGLPGVELDPVDERAHAGLARGWPMRIEKRGQGAALVIDELPQSRLAYTLECQPAEPDGIEFSVQFTFGKAPAQGPRKFWATWACYMNAYDDVRFTYAQGSSQTWHWAALGEKPDIIVGEQVGYVHKQQIFEARRQAMPLGYGRVGKMALVLMIDDARVKFFVVNAGGHLSYSPVQNPAWDFKWEIDDYPIGKPVGFHGKLIYGAFESEQQVLHRYRQWFAKQVSLDDAGSR